MGAFDRALLRASIVSSAWLTVLMTTENEPWAATAFAFTAALAAHFEVQARR